MAAKKRAPGAGRKPKGEFSQLTSLFAVRMPQDLRKQIEQAADESHRSVSQEVIKRLNDSFDTGRNKGRDQTTRAICFLISEIASRLGKAALPDGWHSNPFVFRAFKIAVTQLLDALEPSGEMRSPPILSAFEELDKTKGNSRFDRMQRGIARQWIKTWRTPRIAAKTTVDDILWDLYRGPVPPDVVKDYWASVVAEDESARAGAKLNIRAYERVWYGVLDARRDLDLAKPRASGRVLDVRPSSSFHPSDLEWLTAEHLGENGPASKSKSKKTRI